MAWAFSGRLASVLLNATLVDTGPLPAKQRMWQVWGAAVSATPLEVQWIAADGTTVKGSQVLAIPALDTGILPQQLEEINMLINERIRVIAVTASATPVSCSIDYTA